MTMLLEDGKEYVTRSGERVGPLTMAGHHTKYFRDGTHSWFLNGKRWLDRDDPLDIVIEAQSKHMTVPIRTRRELTEGVYSGVSVRRRIIDSKLQVGFITNDATAEELREAAHVLNQIAEFIESES